MGGPWTALYTGELSQGSEMTKKVEIIKKHIYSCLNVQDIRCCKSLNADGDDATTEAPLSGDSVTDAMLNSSQDNTVG